MIGNAFVRNIDPGEYLGDLLAARVDEIQVMRDNLDMTNMSVAADNLARSLIGRPLTADEFEQIRSQMTMFSAPIEEQLVAPESTLVEDLVALESGVPQDVATRLQARIEEQYAARVSQRSMFASAQTVRAELESFFGGRPLQEQTPYGVPETVQQTIGES